MDFPKAPGIASETLAVYLNDKSKHAAASLNKDGGGAIAIKLLL
jgi:hypothetical protein